MADAPEQVDGQQEEKPRSKLPFIIAGFLVLVVVIGIVAFMLLGSEGSDESVIQQESQEVDWYTHQFEQPFVGNLAPPDDQYLYNAIVTIEVKPFGRNSESEALEEIGIGVEDNSKTRWARVINIIDEELRKRTRVELTSQAGRQQLEAVIKNELNAELFKAEINNVYVRITIS